MCGIIAAFQQKKEKGPVNEWIVEQYEEQHNRGTQGFGVIHIDGNMKPTILRATESAKFMFDLHKKNSNMMIVHHRMPTSTPNFMDQTHPIIVENACLEYDWAWVHNGVITNCDELKKKHKDLGFEHYSTEVLVEQYNKTVEKYNDSEALAVELSLYMEGKLEDLEFRGGAAFIGMKMDKTTKVVKEIVFGRESNPLNLAKTRGEIYLSSEGKGDKVKEGIIYSFNPRDPEMEFTQKALIKKPLPKVEYLPKYSGGSYPSAPARKWNHQTQRYEDIPHAHGTCTSNKEIYDNRKGTSVFELGKTQSKIGFAETTETRPTPNHLNSPKELPFSKEENDKTMAQLNKDKIEELEGPDEMDIEDAITIAMEKSAERVNDDIEDFYATLCSGVPLTAEDVDSVVTSIRMKMLQAVRDVVQKNLELAFMDY